jgi:hypothetical protein
MKKTLLLLFLVPLFSMGQVSEKFPVDDDYVRGLIEKFKKESRGPYKDLRWFCDDGTLNPPKEPCESGGVQHARYADEVVALGEKNHVFLGQILASTDFEAFWDAPNDHSRLKQYMVEKYLKSVDDGWINRRAQFYRGHIQAEDESEWGKNFFLWLLEKPGVLEENFYLVRQAVKDIPHSGDDNVAQLMRSQSKAIADAFPAFQNLRIKIHGQPTREDIASVKAFKEKNTPALSNSLSADLDELIGTMEQFFAPVDIQDLKTGLSPVTAAGLRQDLSAQIDKLSGGTTDQKIQHAAEAMWTIREGIGSEPAAGGKLALLDLSLKLESMMISTLSGNQAGTLKSLLDQVCYLSMASAASGYTETWEWEQLRGNLNPSNSASLTLEELNTIADAARNQLNWGTSYNKAVFDEDVTRFEGFEPKSSGFYDDRIRGSIALYLGNKLGRLGSVITKEENLNNQVLGVSNESQISGLNPGYANGKLVIVEGNLQNMDVDPNSIYAFQRPPSDLRPVAGILNIAEGNLVSHLQLLARNLGIPNASISDENLQELKKYNGQRVFYAVSNKGTVILKLEKEMSAAEKALFKEEVRNEEMIEVPVEKIRLDQTTILNLTEVDAKSSGVVCGPKAANLGELKKNFPDHVVDGFVIPFGIFRAHLDQPIPGQDQTYWGYLTDIYASARKMKAEGRPAPEVEKYQLDQFAKLSKMIIEMPMLPGFTKDLEDSFTGILGKSLGQQPVFLRSDTNMEDLASFTGAGLNLTLFNIRERDAVVNGIKQVWASPFSDRSYRWRQKYLNNPENVYPSIVVIPGVDNDCSGVMITKGVSSGRTDEITVAMSRGVGGAVEGQLAETWAIRKNGEHHLIAPSRELYYNNLSPNGGTRVKEAALNGPIMDQDRIAKVNSFSKELISTMESRGIEGPYDVELGFKDGKIWLFQVRPFVENKGALSSEYLQSITPEVDQNKAIRLNSTL